MLLLLISCSSSRQDNPQERQVSDSVVVVPAPRGSLSLISPGHCRVIATVVALDSTREAGSPDDLCAKAPCLALVTIDSVLGYGSGFLSPLAAGQRVTVRFTYTLAPTANLVPALRPALPGLQPGDRFRADLEETGDGVPGAAARAVLSVSTYEKKSTTHSQERE